MGFTKRLLVWFAVAFTGSAVAQYDCSNSGEEANCKPESSVVGWYLGAELGYNRTGISQSRLNEFYNQSGITAQAVGIEKTDLGYKAFVGYQFNQYIGVEAGYQDLGTRQVNFVGEYALQQVFYDHAQTIYPESGKGVFSSLVASYPLTDNLSLAGKLGLFNWEGRYLTNEFSQSVGSHSTSGTDLMYGVELNYRLARQWQAYIAASRINLARDQNDQLSVGVRYYFSDGTTTEEVPSKSQRPLERPLEKMAVELADSDHDGVVDLKDSCPASDIQFRVNDVGCTLFAEQQVAFKLVIHYDNDSAIIDQKYAKDIREMAEFIEKYQVRELVVYGHTSEPGSVRYNQKLSEQRARSVARALVDEYGINESMIETVGKGESELLNPVQSEEADRQNRRVEVTINEVLSMPVTR
ncbi:OmpA family protein [Alteromonas aestuariivivens]|nr:OmpA family protein [Alteromonas aestuariivivens]